MGKRGGDRFLGRDPEQTSNNHCHCLDFSFQKWLQMLPQLLDQKEKLYAAPKCAYDSLHRDMHVHWNI